MGDVLAMWLWTFGGFEASPCLSLGGGVERALAGAQFASESMRKAGGGKQVDFLEIVHLGTEVIAEIKAAKSLAPGETEVLPPIKIKVNGEHYTIDAKLTRPLKTN